MLDTLSRYQPGSGDPIERYIRPNAETAFGKAHGFADIQSYDEFKQAIPLQTYARLTPFITAAAAGEPNILTRETPIAFELTSGTSSATKLIPITPAFQAELAAALHLWMHSWNQRSPGIFDGPAYWSISPRIGDQSEHGLDDDGAYFPDDIRLALHDWLLVPEQPDFESTARALLAEPNLRSVSVWSPVFFLKLDEALNTDATWREIWPNLKIVSCWADAQASMWTNRVIERLGDRALFEPKGLLATEGVTSIPLGGRNQLACGIHFHEFIDCETGDVLTRPESGHRYEVVLTTGAGLYRYRTNDIIELRADGHVTFIGRAGDISDMVGEKLDAEQVTSAFRSAGTSGFVRASELRYQIWSTGDPEPVLATLRSNLHFAAALDSGQLEPCEFHTLPENWQTASATALAESRGAREGDVKLPLLERGELAELWKS
jgi:hypothetical protein